MTVYDKKLVKICEITWHIHPATFKLIKATMNSFFFNESQRQEIGCDAMKSGVPFSQQYLLKNL
mgnify:CR=1 FL=1